MIRKQGIFFFLLFTFFSLSGIPSFSQPLGEEITVIDDTPTFADLENLEAITPDGPVILAKTDGEDREPKASILNNGTTTVFWVNRNGSHHVSGIDANGNRLKDIIEESSAEDIIVGINTGSNTNWTLNKADRVGGGFLAAATYKYGQLMGSEAQLPETIGDADGIVQDDGQGHGFFRLFDENLEPITPPISISQFSAGHREWDCCWLSDGKFVIGTVCRGHRYEADPDYPTGGDHVATINIFNADGTRFMDEIYVSEDLTGSQEDFRLGALGDGFVAMYVDNDSSVGGSRLDKGIIFDNEGNRLKEFIATDEETGIGVSWMDGSGTNTFVTIHQTNGPADIGLPDDMVDFPVLLGQIWNSEGERVGPYLVVSQHGDGRSLGRPRCAVAPNGTIVFSWDDNLADDVQFTTSVVGRIFNSDGSPATDAFVVHPLPEFEETLGGDPGEPIPAIHNEVVSFAWGSRAVPEGAARDIVAMVFHNPAEGTPVINWALY